MNRLLFVAVLAAPSVARANTKAVPVLAVPLAGAVVPVSPVASLSPRGGERGGVRGLSVQSLSPVLALSPAARVSGELSGLRRAALLSGTVEGGRAFWDLAAAGTGSPESPVHGRRSGGVAAVTLAPAQPAVEETPAPAVEQTRWQRMKASTRHDFKALFANLRELRRSLAPPTSRAALGTNARAIGRFFSQFRQLGWKVIGAVVLYYLIRDTILYGPLLYLLLKGLFG